MGPIHDQPGLEQGGSNHKHYKIYNNEQLVTAQESGFGASLSGYQAAAGTGFQVASVGQADDMALVSNNIQQLQHFLNLFLIYCKKQLSAEKTKLLLYSKTETDYTKNARLLSPLHIDDTPIPFADTAEHVGVLRLVSGSLLHILQRIVYHKRVLVQILSMGTLLTTLLLHCELRKSLLHPFYSQA